MSGSQFYEWLFGPETFSGLSRNGPHVFQIQCSANQIYTIALACG